MSAPICKGCNLPMPNDWCWENKLLDCWSSLPPRNINQHAVLDVLRDLVQRVEMIEERETDELG